MDLITFVTRRVNAGYTPSRTYTLGARTVAIVIVSCLSVGLAACSSPTKPGVTVASARPVSPTNGAQPSYYKQPVMLVAANGVATGGTSLADIFDVATDATFTDTVATKDGVTRGSWPDVGHARPPQTVEGVLLACQDYRWR
jgi:hypothetical protein